MVKCPNCNKEIDELRFYAKVETFGTFTNDEINNCEWYEDERGDWEDLELRCPECDKVLFNDQEEALDFLNEEVKGGKNGI